MKIHPIICACRKPEEQKSTIKVPQLTAEAAQSTAILPLGGGKAHKSSETKPEEIEEEEDRVHVNMTP